MTWLREHLVGVAVFAPAVIILAMTAFYAWGTHRKRYLPWLFFVVWFVAILAHYLIFNVGRLYSDAREMWAAQLFTLSVVTAVPLILTVLPYTFPAQTTGTRRGLAFGGMILGLLAILCVAPLSQFLAQLLDPFIHAARP